MLRMQLFIVLPLTICRLRKRIWCGCLKLSDGVTSFEVLLIVLVFRQSKTLLGNEVCAFLFHKEYGVLSWSLKSISQYWRPSFILGDVSMFTQRLRLHCISHNLVKERLEIDPHERGSEESRWWGLLRADSTSVIVHDARSNGYQLLTVGDPQVVTSLCHEAWQGKKPAIGLAWNCLGPREYLVLFRVSLT